MMKIEFTVSDHNFDHDVLASTEPVVVQFTASWCSPCVRYEPVLKAAHAVFGEGVRLARMDIDDNQTIPQRYGVVNVPTLLMFYRGKVLRAIEGIQDQDSLVEAFRALAAQTGGAPPRSIFGDTGRIAPR
ncbi:MAG: thioredoxin domain-containing protein [Nitrospirota bacterium]|jgi:thioredoxin 1